jgi:hypothetical protein
LKVINWTLDSYSFGDPNVVNQQAALNFINKAIANSILLNIKTLTFPPISLTA